jgi:hypothetical protein
MIARVPVRSDSQLPWTVVHCAHRVRGVFEQVQNYLLKLDAIPCHDREIFGEFGPQNNPVSLEFAQRQRDHLARGVIQVHRLARGFLPGEERT